MSWAKIAFELFLVSYLNMSRVCATNYTIELMLVLWVFPMNMTRHSLIWKEKLSEFTQGSNEVRFSATSQSKLGYRVPTTNWHCTKYQNISPISAVIFSIQFALFYQHNCFLFVSTRDMPIKQVIKANICIEMTAITLLLGFF